jgi:hypothetical protein
LNAPGKLVDDQRAVFVPQQAPFVGGLGSGNLDIDPAFDATSGAVFLGSLDLHIDASAVPGTQCELRLAVSDLLIAAVTTATPGDEPAFFGFESSGPEPASGTGSVVGATSTLADVVMIIGMPNTPDSDGDADVDLADHSDFVDCMTGPGSANLSFNCEVFDVEPDADVDLADFQRLAETFASP